MVPYEKAVIAKPTAKIDQKVDSVSEAYTAAEEKVKLTITGEGSGTIVHGGDGDVGIETRVYLDGVKSAVAPGNEVAIITAGFNTKLEVKTYSATAQTAKNSSFHVAGWMFA